MHDMERHCKLKPCLRVLYCDNVKHDQMCTNVVNHILAVYQKSINLLCMYRKRWLLLPEIFAWLFLCLINVMLSGSYMIFRSNFIMFQMNPRSNFSAVNFQSSQLVATYKPQVFKVVRYIYIWSQGKLQRFTVNSRMII